TPGTVLHSITGGTLGAALKLRTPAGVLETWTEENDGSLLVGVDRTARTIATTTIHLPEALGTAVDAPLARATRRGDSIRTNIAEKTPEKSAERAPGQTDVQAAPGGTRVVEPSRRPDRRRRV